MTNPNLKHNMKTFSIVAILIILCSIMFSLCGCNKTIYVPIVQKDTTYVRVDTFITKTDSIAIYYPELFKVTTIDTIYRTGNAETKIIYDVKTLYVKTKCYGDTVIINDTILKTEYREKIVEKENKTAKLWLIVSFIILWAALLFAIGCFGSQFANKPKKRNV
jgi:hypothetical protein